MRILRTTGSETPPPVEPFALTLYLRWGSGLDTVSSREDAFNWIINWQLGRRNVTLARRSYLRGKRYQNEKQAQGRLQIKGDTVSPLGSTEGDTAERLAKEHGVSGKTIKRDADFAAAVDDIAGFDNRVGLLVGWSTHANGGTDHAADTFRFIANRGGQSFPTPIFNWATASTCVTTDLAAFNVRLLCKFLCDGFKPLPKMDRLFRRVRLTTGVLVSLGFEEQLKLVEMLTMLARISGRESWPNDRHESNRLYRDGSNRRRYSGRWHPRRKANAKAMSSVA